MNRQQPPIYLTAEGVMIAAGLIVLILFVAWIIDPDTIPAVLGLIGRFADVVARAFSVAMRTWGAPS